MPSRRSETEPALAIVDAVARAAHLWISHLCQSGAVLAGERLAFAGGLVRGLAELLALDADTEELVAYAFILRSQEDAEALALTREMLARPAGAILQAAYRLGEEEARNIIGMLMDRPVAAPPPTQLRCQ